MLRTKILAILAIVIWLLLLLIVWGSFRNEFSHTYAHWIEDMELPSLTRILSAPFIGISTSTGTVARSTVWFVWGLLWLSPIVLVVAVIRVPNEQDALGIWISWGSLYFAFALLVFLLVAVGLWLPFALL
jgi:hypothetical protein